VIVGLSSRVAIALLIVPTILAAQAEKASGAPLADAQQIAAAVAPLPMEFRENARVLGYHAGSPKLIEIRKGGGPFTCIATDPAQPRYHAACYHNSMEPFMLRGRELRDQGVKGDKVDTARFAEVKSGKIVMPKFPAALYQLNGPGDVVDASTGAVKGAAATNVIYIPFATSASTGLSAQPVQGSPWIMFPGTPKAHIMLVGKM
jgi:hypothetical protein